jgi:hypothetical protein
MLQLLENFSDPESWEVEEGEVVELLSGWWFQTLV